MQITVNYQPSVHRVSKFWWKNHQLDGIAEWAEVCQHENVDFDYDFDHYDHDFYVNDVWCNDCENMTEQEKLDWIDEHRFDFV